MQQEVEQRVDAGFYDEDYYERGLVSGKSLYTNYTWLPELTIPLAHRIIRYLGVAPGSTLLDFGCAKGYLVKAMRLLDVNAWGYDISPYALTSCDEMIRPYCDSSLEQILIQNQNAIHYMVAKDVFEHMQPEDILETLATVRDALRNLMLVIVPLGEDGVYNIPAYGLDKSHVIAENVAWWERLFKNAGYEMVFSGTQLPGLKPNWDRYSNGNGFFIISAQYKTEPETTGNNGKLRISVI